MKSLGWGLSQYGCNPYEGQWGHTVEDHMKTQREDSHVPAKERGLRRIQACCVRKSAADVQVTQSLVLGCGSPSKLILRARKYFEWTKRKEEDGWIYLSEEALWLMGTGMDNRCSCSEGQCRPCSAVRKGSFQTDDVPSCCILQTS